MPAPVTAAGDHLFSRLRPPDVLDSAMVNTISTTSTDRPGAAYRPAAKASASAKTETDPRTIRDVIDVGGNAGEKVVNLARGTELAAALPDATQDRDAFDAALKAALEDIQRIMSLFGGVLDLLRQSPSLLTTSGEDNVPERRGRS